MVRRTIDEFVSISKREPSLKHLFVEGEQDKRIYGGFLGDFNLSNVSVYPVSLVDVELPLQPREGAGSGNRARIIELAITLFTKDASPQTVLCIVDTDLGFILPKGPQIRGLIYTDVTAIELYFWDALPLENFLRKYCGILDIEGNRILSIMTEPLTRMFSIRLALTSLNLPVGWIEGASCLQYKEESLQFDWKEHIVRLLNKSGNGSWRDKVIEKSEYYFSLLMGDARFYIHGHDFLKTLRFLLLKINPGLNTILTESTFFRIISICDSAERLKNFETFRSLLKFCVEISASESTREGSLVSTVPEPAK